MKKNILLVDDEEEILELIEGHIDQSFDVHVIKAHSATEAIEILESNPSLIHLIISDYKMPDGDGLELFMYLKTQQLSIPFILCSGHVNAYEVGISGENVIGSIAKPDVFKELVPLMKSVL